MTPYGSLKFGPLGNQWESKHGAASAEVFVQLLRCFIEQAAVGFVPPGLRRNRFSVVRKLNPPDRAFVACDQQNAHGTVDIAIVHLCSPAFLLFFQKYIAA